jgi:hypothetical protein
MIDPERADPVGEALDTVRRALGTLHDLSEDVPANEPPARMAALEGWPVLGPAQAGELVARVRRLPGVLEARLRRLEGERASLIVLVEGPVDLLGALADQGLPLSFRTLGGGNFPAQSG